ncbi:MAG TPA: MFS transporter [Lentzea sp.]
MLIQRAAIALVQVLGLAVWFSMSAVVPSLRHEWGISAGAAVWLTASVQLGFVTGAVGATVLNLADRVRPHLLLATAAATGAALTLILGLTVDGIAAAIPLRFLTGVALAGVYPVGMKLMASWSEPKNRGKALGVLIGALTLGSALPHVFGQLPWREVLVAAAAIAFLGALTAVALVRPGPFLTATTAQLNPRYAVQMFRERKPRLVNLGYFGHMWELYALWTWLPTFLISAQKPVGLTVFLTMGVAGFVGCLIGGWAADRFGRAPAAVGALTVSGLCCLLSPLAWGTPVLIAFAAVWGASVIADSGVFSASLSEVADPRYVGTALTALTAIGFGLTVVSIQLVPLLAEIVTWRYAFLLLVPGPVIGALAMLRTRS